MLIDGVFSGGGIKGFALVGAYQALEEKGFIFKRLAGTSAGALIAAFIAAGYKSNELVNVIHELNVKSLLDPRKIMISSPLTKWLTLYWKMGLYKGNRLECWIEQKLAQKGIRIFADLERDALRLIASDITNGKMLVLPKDLEHYGIDPLSFSVAKAVRMSCSLPYFFEPVKLKAKNGKVIIVDGGVLSNFPIFLFDEENNLRKRPAIGVKLSARGSKHKQNKVNNAIDLFPALFETMKDAHDARYISRRHEKDIIFIPTRDVSTTEFHLSDEKKTDLIQIGKKKTELFLKTWTY